MTFEQLQYYLRHLDSPVILLEGTRALPPEMSPRLTAVAGRLASAFPQARFRTGNAPGSDEAFAEGVARVSPERLEFILPQAGHRAGRMPAQSLRRAYTELPKVAEARIVDETLRSSPIYGQMLQKREQVPRLQASARYILRDTLKVTGLDAWGMSPASIGLFYVNEADPMKGGTGHTIRVCHSLEVPVVFQQVWLGW